MSLLSNCEQPVILSVYKTFLLSLFCHNNNYIMYACETVHFSFPLKLMFHILYVRCYRHQLTIHFWVRKTVYIVLRLHVVHSISFYTENVLCTNSVDSSDNVKDMEWQNYQLPEFTLRHPQNSIKTKFTHIHFLYLQTLFLYTLFL